MPQSSATPPNQLPELPSEAQVIAHAAAIRRQLTPIKADPTTADLFIDLGGTRLVANLVGERLQRLAGEVELSPSNAEIVTGCLAAWSSIVEGLHSSVDVYRDMDAELAPLTAYVQKVMAELEADEWGL